MNHKPVVPKDASAIILLDQKLRKVLWARRNPKLKFLGGFHSFPGGKVDTEDFHADVRNCENEESVPLIASAVREVFEEVGVLLVRNGDKLTTGQIASLHDDLISQRSTFAEILNHWNLWIDAEDFFYTGFWTTPEFSPIRFKTRFFIAVCPSKQIPYRAISELEEPEFIHPESALEIWRRSQVLISPPVLISLQELASRASQDQQISLDTVSRNLLKKSENAHRDLDYIELNPRFTCLPLRTNTLPPATHTNCFIVGKQKFVVIDAASTDENEQRKLFKLVDQMIVKGNSCEAIIVSHLHPDHFGGETALQRHLFNEFGIILSISSHRITAESLKGKVEILTFIDDGQSYALADEYGNKFILDTLHTPGHARGHLCFYNEEFGFLLSSDNVVGLGTVVIAPPEGNMIDYLNSLERMKNLPNLNFLCGSHGAAVSDAKGRIAEYIEHRLMREDQVLQCVRQGSREPNSIAIKIYEGLNSHLMPLAEKSVIAHLEKLRIEGRI